MSRIIAGRAGGRRLQMPAHDRTRPTTDRTREALFSALAGWVGATGADSALSGLSFLDLFGGSGAVGLEAASRGAQPVLIVESDRRTAEVARRNAAATGLVVTVRSDRAERVPQTGEAFDIVWLDPPYDLATPALDDLLRELIAHGTVAPAGLIVVERSSRSEPVSFPEGWDSWNRRYGETTLYYAQQDTAQQEAARDATQTSSGEETS